MILSILRSRRAHIAEIKRLEHERDRLEHDVFAQLDIEGNALREREYAVRAAAEAYECLWPERYAPDEAMRRARATLRKVIPDRYLLQILREMTGKDEALHPTWDDAKEVTEGLPE